MQPPLTMTCSIARGGTADTFGQLGTAPVVATGVKCHWWSGTPSQTSSQGLPGVVATESERILFALGTDIRQGDHITTVVTQQGATVFSATDYRVVEHVLMRRNHLDCFLAYGKGIGGRA